MTKADRDAKPKWNYRTTGGGQFKAGPKCDACGKPTGDNYATDDRVCENTDGPGFYLCSRKTCQKACDSLEAEGGVEALRRLYTAQRAKSKGAL